MSGESPPLRAPSIRGTYGLLGMAGACVLAVGLTLPFLFADPVRDEVATGGTVAPLVPDGGELPLDGGSSTTIAGPVAPVGGGDGPGSTVPGGGGAGGELRVASDVGITADAILVGVPVPDTRALGDTEGGVKFGESVGDLQKQYSAAIDDINDRGGINNRRVDAVYRLYDPVDPDSMRAACIYLTEQMKVFAVLGGFYGDPILCITEQHKTLLVAQASEPDDFYARSKGLYFSVYPTKDRMLRNLVVGLHRDKALEGRTIGILDQEGIDAIPVDRTLIPELKKRGYKIAHHSRIAADAGAAQSQIPLEVQQMRSAEVDAVIVASGLIRATVFVQEGDSQRFRPTYVLSDFASGASDIYTIAMPDSFAGALAYTSLRTGEAASGLPEAPHDAACRKVYEAREGKIDRTSSEYYYVVTSCGITRLFERGMRAAGVNPTRASLSAALQGLGPIDVPYAATGTWRAGKFDGADSTRRVTWKLECRCYRPIDSFQAMPG